MTEYCLDNKKPPKRLLAAAKKLKKSPTKFNVRKFLKISKQILREAGHMKLSHVADVSWRNGQRRYSLEYQAGTEGEQVDFLHPEKRSIVGIIKPAYSLKVYRLGRKTLELEVSDGKSRTKYDF